MVQEFVPGGGGCQFSSQRSAARGSLCQIVARRTRQFPPDFGRASTFVETVDEPGVIEASLEILAAMRATGLVELEYKRDPRTGVLKLLDVNPRAWGWHSVGARAGVDFPYLLWQLVHGNPVQKVHGAAGVKWRRLSWDWLGSPPTVPRSARVRGYASFGGPRVAAIFAADDPLPGLLEVPLFVFILCARLARGDGV